MDRWLTCMERASSGRSKPRYIEGQSETGYSTLFGKLWNYPWPPPLAARSLAGKHPRGRSGGARIRVGH